jgi:hypothetical protein
MGLVSHELWTVARVRVIDRWGQAGTNQTGRNCLDQGRQDLELQNRPSHHTFAQTYATKSQRLNPPAHRFPGGEGRRGRR